MKVGKIELQNHSGEHNFTFTTRYLSDVIIYSKNSSMSFELFLLRVMMAPKINLGVLRLLNYMRLQEAIL